MSYVFTTGAQLLDICTNENIPIYEAMLRRELELGELSRNALREEMRVNLDVMRASIQKGLTRPTARSPAFPAGMRKSWMPTPPPR